MNLGFTRDRNLPVAGPNPTIDGLKLKSSDH